MNQKLIEAREFIVKAREALRRGDKNTARDLGEKAVLLMPNLEDGWLILVAADSNPKDALSYAKKALELNPESSRAHKALEWARGQLKRARSVSTLGLTVEAVSIGQLAGPIRDVRTLVHRPINVEGKKGSGQDTSWWKKSNWQPLVYVGVLFSLLICAIVISVAAWSAINNSALAAFLPTQEVLWAQVDIAKPGVTPIDVSVFASQADSAVSTSAFAAEASSLGPTETPIPTEALAATPEATETPGVMAMEVLADTPTSEYVPPVVARGSGKGGGRWIDVNLSTQSVYAYEGDTVVNSFIVSTGTWMTPTVTGKYKIYMKLTSGNMSGPGYFLPNVPYIMYFYKGYGLHGTYWHNNFGTPMSHGCVNLRTSDAEWLYHWASIGTVVKVHY